MRLNQKCCDAVMRVLFANDFSFRILYTAVCFGALTNEIHLRKASEHIHKRRFLPSIFTVTTLAKSLLVRVGCLMFKASSCIEQRACYEN